MAQQVIAAQEEEHTQHRRWLDEVMITESRILFLEINAVVTDSSSSSCGGTTAAVQQQWSSTYRPIPNGSTAVRAELGGVCTVIRFSTFRERARAVSGRDISRPLLAELGLVGRCVAGDTEG